MAVELEQKKTEFAEERRLALEKYEATLRDKQAESDAVLHTSQADRNAAIRVEQAQSTQQQMALDAKWVNQLQVDQAKKQKDVNDDFMHLIAELQQQ